MLDKNQMASIIDTKKINGNKNCRKLHVMMKKHMRDLEKILESTEVINNYNMNVSLSREVNDAVVEIKSVVDSLTE